MSKWNEMRGKDQNSDEKEISKAIANADDDGQELRYFIESRKKQKDRFEKAGSGDYYFCVCFESLEQRDECWRLVGISPEKLYIDGCEVAKHLCIRMPDEDELKPEAKSAGNDYTCRTMDKSYYHTTIFYPEEVRSIKEFYRILENASEAESKYIRSNYGQVERTPKS